MSVAIVHYHLRRGGVTRVIEAQSQALRHAGINHVILSGTPGKGPFDLPVALVPELDYRGAMDDLTGPDLAARLRAAAARCLGQPPAIWHLHNPVLGKNALFPPLVSELARARERLVLHVHDFAEDGRPGDYRSLRAEAFLYPVAPQIRYAFINSRDRALLIQAGLPEQRATFLPNPVLPAAPPHRPPDPRVPPAVLYPVRGIRRKNLGELCLLAALAPAEATFALTLAPENPKWRPFYDLWTGAAVRERLNVRFDVANRLAPAPGIEPTYENWLAHSSHILTTSVAEGFGLAFLEPIALRKPLLGRDLPEITADFEAHGLQLGDLYDELLIPGEWVDRDALFKALTDCLRHQHESYGLPFSADRVRQSWQVLFRGDHLDFGNLPEDLQVIALGRARVSPRDVLIGHHGVRRSAAPWLANALATTTPRCDPAALDHYSLPRYADQLKSIYRDLTQSPSAPPEWLDKARVLQQFLKPERFHFLRSS